MDAVVAQQLATLEIDDEAVCEYVARLVEEEDLEEEERREAVCDYLGACTTMAVDKVVDTIFAAWQQQAQQAQQQAELSHQQRLDEARVREKQELAADVRTEADGVDPVTVVKEMSREEKARREHMLARYAFDLDELVETANGEVEILYKDRDSHTSGASTTSGQAMSANTNRSAIAEKERQMRDTLRDTHQKKVERDRQLLEKQKADKEAEKRRTQKREKRRM